MIDACFWWDEATKFSEQARVTEDLGQQQEFLELAQICEDVAVEIEDRATPG
jgi:hypothetical protein